jgi:TonB family protein
MESHWNVLWYLAGVTVRSLGLAAIAWAAMGFGRVKSPATRHAVWTAVTAGMLVLAAATAALPQLPVRVLRARPPAAPPPVQTALQAARVPDVVLPMRESRPVPWNTVVGGVYFAGLLVFAGRLAYGYLLTQRLVRASRVVPRFGAGRVYESGCISVPFTVGCMRPKILLPEGWDTWPPEKLDAVLVHERTHVRRADWAIAVMAGVNRCVFWFHPLAWWIARRLTVLAEQACDDASLSQVSSRECYAQVLVEMAAAVRSRGGRVAWGAMAMAKATEVRVRVERILDESRQIWPGVTRARWLTVAACGLPLVYMAAVVRPARVRAQAAHLVPGAVAQAAEQAKGPAPRKPAGGANAKFVEGELAAARQELDRLDAEVARFKMENMGRFPEQFQANVAQLNSYQMMLSTAHEALSRLQQQRLMLETQLQNNITNLGYYQTSSDDQPSAVTTSESLVQLNQRILILRSEVAALSEQLTPNHPSIKRAQASLEALERRHEDVRKGVNPRAAQVLLDLTASNNVLKTEMQNLNLQMDEKVKQTEELTRTIASYQSRIESSPRLEQEYAELLRAQGLARQQVEELSRAPGTASGPSLISRRDPEYTAAAKQAGIQGTVELSVTIGTDGVARDIQVIRSLDAGLDRKAIDSVRTWRFRPASRNGEAVTAFASVEVRFRLP